MNPTSCTFRGNGTGSFTGVTCAPSTYEGVPAVLISGLPAGPLTQLAFKFQMDNPKVSGLFNLKLVVIDQTNTPVS